MAKALPKWSINSIVAAGLMVCTSLLVPPYAAVTSCTTRVTTSPDPIWVSVDGESSLNGGTYNWPVGSKHELLVESIAGLSAGTRYAFSNWTAGTTAISSSPRVTISADPALPLFTANFTKEYLVSVMFAGCDTSTDSTCSLPGTVLVNGTAATGNTYVWVTAGGTITLQATPNSGYIFAGWTGSNSSSVITGFLATVTVNSTMSVTPSFQVARKVNFATVPEGLQVMADRATMTTPAVLEWGRGSTHVVSVVSPQTDRYGKYWVFDSWDNGSAMSYNYVVNDTLAPDTLTANFTAAARVSLLTVPTGVKLSVDGKNTWSSYNFTWGLGETHKVEAPAEATDSQGRKWVFQGWSDNLAAAHEITVPSDAADNGVRLTASYRQLGRITVNSSQSGVKVSVDGTSCATPCTVDRTAGESVRISAPASVVLSEGSRADFQSWSDGSTGDLSLTSALEAKTVTATYKVMNRLTAVSDPVDGATIQVSPSSTDGYYETGTAVALSVVSKGGYRFRKWEGDLIGTSSISSISLSAPKTVRALLEKVAYIAPAGVRNGAGDGTGEAVAPGSVITISGANLAGELVTGPESPLAQTLGNVTVRIGERLLPLFYVSPEQISAQLPPDLDLGTASLAVRWANQTEIQAQFEVVRDAPGLFQNAADNRAWAVAAHADGKSVTTASPAKRGEKLLLYGTGFGPTEPARPMGFAVPSEPVYALLDTPTLRVGEAVVAVSAAYAAAGRVGVDAVEFTLPETVAAGTPVSVVAIVGGRESNAVVLPVE